MNHNTKSKRSLTTAIATGLLLAGLAGTSSVQAADHKDSTIVDTRIAGDITDFFTFIDPARPDHVVLMFGVTPFLNPNENPTNHFEENYLYQIKIDNDQSNGVVEDLVVQIEFDPLADRGTQTYSIKLGTPKGGITGPLGNKRLGSNKIICSGTVFTGANNDSFDAGIQDCATGQIFAGVSDDSFSIDVAQNQARIGLNPDPVGNALTNTQDVQRGFSSALFGVLRGRPLRADGNSGLNSGVDGVGGFNIGNIAVSIPVSTLRGSGIPDPSQDGAVNPSLIATWATVSRPKREKFDGFAESGLEEASNQFNQFDRNGQELFNPVFGFQLPPFNAPEALSESPFGIGPVDAAVRPVASDYPSTGIIKDLINATGPEDDIANFGYLFPDTILSSELVLPTNLNTIQGRATLLTLGGFTAPQTGVPLLVPQLAADSPIGRTRDALRQLMLPDALRLNLDVVPDATRAGAAASGNTDPVLSIARWGLHNGRRPADDVTDIFVRLAREAFDVKFPDNLVVAGIGLTEFPGAGPLLDRRSLNCENLDLGIFPVLGSIVRLEACADARVFSSLQGTDWIEPTQADVNNTATQIQLREMEASFPYVGRQHPVPGEPGTLGFPTQHEDDVL